MARKMMQWLHLLALGAVGFPPVLKAAAQATETTGSVSVPATLQVTGACVAVTVGALLASVYLLPTWLLGLLARNSHPSVLWCAFTHSRVCSLTIDDAPSASTPAILDVLRAHKVKATFFIISGNIPGNEEVLRRIVREGHTLGNHLTEDRASILDELHIFEQKLKECDRAISEFQPSTAETPALEPLVSDNNAIAPASSDEKDSSRTTTTATTTETSSNEKQDGDVVRPALETSASTTTVAGDTLPNGSKWMRPASGWFTSPMREITQRHGYRICLGSVYPHDAQIRSEIINSLHLRTRTRCGSVIIVHDRSWTIGVLKTALPELTRKFAFVSLDELIVHQKRAPTKASQ